MFHFPSLQKKKQKSTMMVLPRPVFSLSFLMIVAFSTIIIPRGDCLQDDLTLNDNLEEAMSPGFGFPAFPSYLSGLEEGKCGLEDGKFKDLTTTTATTSTSATVVSVDDFGAKAHGTDDTVAFAQAWKQACSSTGVFVVPRNTYRIKPIRFTGPCKFNVTVQIYGVIDASDNRTDYKEDSRHWIRFDNVQHLAVGGGGTVDGNGKIWWQNSCRVNKKLPCKDAPTALTFYNCSDLMVKSLRIQNAQHMHVTFESSKNVRVSGLTVTAPEDSPNTDGIHVTTTQNIEIADSVIGTGDDCISIVSGSQDVQVMDVTCGPGHGISIGSLGKGNSVDYVSRVTVDGAKLSGTTNGVRIKTWQGGSGSASNIIFKNIEMKNVTNPIIIDQNYCDQDKPCNQQESAVQVKNVTYENIWGTSSSRVAINLDCSKTHPCQAIWLQNVTLSEQGGKAAKAICNNVVKLNEVGVVIPRCP